MGSSPTPLNSFFLSLSMSVFLFFDPREFVEVGETVVGEVVGGLR